MRFARLKSGAVRWWSDQLEKLSDKPSRSFVVRSLLFWGTPRTIVQLAKELSVPVDGLDTSELRRIIHVLERTRRERIILSDSDVSTLKRSSPRLLAILAARASHSNIDQIVSSVILDYRGSDVSVMKMSAEILSRHAFYDVSQWKKALPIIRRAYKMDISVDAVSWAERSHKEVIDASTANEILRSAQEYPLSLVNVAQNYLTKSAASKAKAPGDVAAAEHWFT
jgi:hypothetical protein